MISNEMNIVPPVFELRSKRIEFRVMTMKTDTTHSITKFIQSAQFIQVD